MKTNKKWYWREFGLLKFSFVEKLKLGFELHFRIYWFLIQVIESVVSDKCFAHWKRVFPNNIDSWLSSGRILFCKLFVRLHLFFFPEWVIEFFSPLDSNYDFVFVCFFVQYPLSCEEGWYRRRESASLFPTLCIYWRPSVLLLPSYSVITILPSFFVSCIRDFLLLLSIFFPVPDSLLFSFCSDVDTHQ